MILLRVVLLEIRVKSKCSIIDLSMYGPKIVQIALRECYSPLNNLYLIRMNFLMGLLCLFIQDVSHASEHMKVTF